MHILKDFDRSDQTSRLRHLSLSLSSIIPRKLSVAIGLAMISLTKRSLVRANHRAREFSSIIFASRRHQ